MSIWEMAPAKVNLFLQVLGKRVDGYHELVTVFQTIDLYDEIELEPRPEGIQLTCSSPELPTGPENLAYRAAELLITRASGGVAIHLKKAIPWQAGLGGGSSNAAAVLRGLNRLWGMGLSLPELAGLAAQLGSDVPFFIYGGTALGTGRGEIIQPIQQNVRLDLLLVKPSFGLATPAVFRAYRPTGQVAPDIGAFLAALGSGDPAQIAQALRNDLEEAAIQLRPELAKLKDTLLRLGALGCLLSGSGSSMFAILPSNYDATKWLEALPSGYKGLFVHA